MLAVRAEPERFIPWDATCDAMLSGAVSNRASRVQGLALLAASERIFTSPTLADRRRDVRDGRAAGHLAPVFGAVSNAIGVQADQAGRLFVFGHLRGLVSAAVRLGIVGPIEGQTIQAQVASHADRMVKLGMKLRPDEAAQTAPILELLAATHDRLYSRLFQS